MNREEAIRAMLDGKKVRPTSWRIGYFFYDIDKREPFRMAFGFSNDKSTNDLWNYIEWELYEEPKPEKRYMTREEVLGFVCNTSGIVVRCDSGIWFAGHYFSFDRETDSYEYAHIDKNGNIGEPHKFMVDVD